MKTPNDEKPAVGRSGSNGELGIPTIYVDDTGSIVVVGHQAYRRTSWIDEGRAIPDKWIKLVTPNPECAWEPDEDAFQTTCGNTPYDEGTFSLEAPNEQN